MKTIDSVTIVNEYEKDILADFEKRKEAVVKYIKKLRKELPPKLPEPEYQSFGLFHEMHLRYPYNRELKSQIENIFSIEGWEKGFEITEAEAGDSSPTTEFVKRGLTYVSLQSVMVEWNIHSKGSSCIRKKIGEETTTETQPIYDYICKENE